MSDTPSTHKENLWDRFGGLIIVGATSCLILLAGISLLWLDDRCSLHNDQQFIERAFQHGTNRVEQIEQKRGHDVLAPFDIQNNFSQRLRALGGADQVEDAPEDWWWKFSCDINATDFAVALFTLVLAGVTALLWWSTHKLWKAGEKQINAATTAAYAASLQAKAMVAQMRPLIALTGRQIELQGGMSSGGSIVTATPGNLTDGMRPVVTIQNAGSGNAFIEAVSCDWFMGREPPEFPIRGNYTPIFYILKPNQTYALNLVQSTLVLSSLNWDARIKAGEWLWIYGSIRFKDVLGSSFEQGFIAHWEELPTGSSAVARGLVIEGPAAYNSLVELSS